MLYRVRFWYRKSDTEKIDIDVYVVAVDALTALGKFLASNIEDHTIKGEYNIQKADKDCLI